MAELKLPRLLAAAKEFNVGQETLIDFLIGKGFSKDDLKPTSKLTEDMYRSLQSEFQSDKVAKMKSDQLELPKSAAEPKKKKEEEEIVFKKEEKSASKSSKKTEEVPAATVVPEETAEKSEKTKSKKEEKEEAAPVVEEVIKAEAPEIEKPKVVKKIDLDKIDSSTRPKKVAKPKKEETPKTEAEKTGKAKAKKTKDEVTEVEKTEEPKIETPVTEEPVTEEQQQAVVENIEVEKLTGPKILGKIELPVSNDTRPVKDEKRKRKRIPIEKKDPKRNIIINKEADKKQGGGNFNRGRSAGGNRRDNRGGGGRREEKLIDEKEIQDKIRETQAKLTGGAGRGKSLKAKLRREKRNEAAEAMGDAEADNKLQVTEFISVSELANLMDVSFAEVISKCMSLGIMVSINQRLDAEVIELVAGEFGHTVEFIDMEKQMEMEEEEDEDEDEDLQPRSPIVTIMGHVDHGKTSLLDYIRNANVVAGEAGGITQHIGAYQVALANGKEITFLDTPGHEAFTAMRARGAKVTDIAVIVIAADDAVMPQTREAISHAQAAGVPMIFAINKIDKDGANSQKIYEQLSQMNLLVEEWGGKFQSQEIAAKKGLNIDKLLEKILLEAELLDLKANPEREATGTIIEASLDKGRGYVATLLVENGTLKQGDLVVSGQHFGRVKALFNERNKKEDSAGPSAPAVILGLNGAPQAGEKFKVYEDESEAKEIANRRAQILREQGIRTKKHITLDEIGRRLALGSFKELKVIIKGDVDGSVEALSDSLQKLSTQEILVSVIHKGVGQINESDIVLAEASDAIVIAFNVRPSLQASRLAENAGIEIKMYSIIYNAIEEVKSAMEGMLEPKVQEKIVANVEIKEVYKFDKATVAGCQVIDGKIKRDSKIRLIRDGIVIYPTAEGANAELGSLKRFKDDAKEVTSGMECGLTIKNYSDLKVGDIVEAYEIEEVKRTL
ncbi:MAG: Translation initiation factor IF-2 [Bacteroidetes bacterium ADurb.BinA245]|jgi:translation initiation factor IF-2|nr:MAG: Translation initiation factor IF-2 [Bacteroidetes bacterium ADurb.BinA245]HND96199.1 translation initiation factor IF-2 [Chitinophagaceae bacterium]HNO00501.1 translation initiation factor IF-2 [Chitinophagaceae bacterium]HNO54830.1 translation initiation factor IF-2 [Chitinophagaceae bacterium]